MHENVLFNFHNDSTKKWPDAKNECVKDGGHLVVLETESKWRFIKEEIQNLQNPTRNEWFIGLSSNASGSDWRWITGEPLITNQHWQPHQPSGDGRCVVIAKDFPTGKQGLFNDLSCNGHQKAFICQLQLPKPAGKEFPLLFGWDFLKFLFQARKLKVNKNPPCYLFS